MISEQANEDRTRVSSERFHVLGHRLKLDELQLVR